MACDRLDGPLSLIVTSVKLWLVLHVLKRDVEPLCITFYANKTGRIIFPIRRLFGMQGTWHCGWAGYLNAIGISTATLIF